MDQVQEFIIIDTGGGVLSKPKKCHSRKAALKMLLLARVSKKKSKH